MFHENKCDTNYFDIKINIEKLSFSALFFLFFVRHVDMFKIKTET